MKSNRKADENTTDYNIFSSEVILLRNSVIVLICVWQIFLNEHIYKTELWQGVNWKRTGKHALEMCAMNKLY